eukprot:g4136.t1
MDGAAVHHHRVRAAHVAPRRGATSGPPPPCSAVAAFAKQVAERAVADFNVTGLGLGVVCNHSVAFTGGFGFADVESREAVTADTLFQVASNSKAFTATVNLQLVDEGRLDLDAPARDADPRFRVLDAYGSAALTPRDLLSHRTGLPRHDQITFAARNRTALLEAVPFLPFDKSVRAQPGEYNNMMLANAGAVAGAVAGAPWEDLVQHGVFDRLNMSRSAPSLGRLRARAGGAAELASCYMQTGGDRGVDTATRVDCLNADVAGPCGSVISSASDFVRWQRLHMRQAVRACAPSTANAPFFTGPRAQIQCPPGTAPPPPLAEHAGTGAGGDEAAAAAAGPSTGSSEYLLSDAAWQEFVRPNTIFPDWHAFGTYSLGLWWEPLYEDPRGWCLHHAGDLPGMASKQAMLPWLGHSVVALTNANENPARFAVVLQILDFMTGHAPPVPSWPDTYLAALAQQRAEAAAADAAWRAEVARIAALPGGSTCPPHGALVGWYAHPAYGNCSVSVAAPAAGGGGGGGAGGAAGAGPGALRVGHCASIWQHSNAEPWRPAFGSLTHLYFNTFAVAGEHLDVGAGTPMLTFHSTRGDGTFDRFESPLEPAVNPIVFVRAGAGYRGQGTGYSDPAAARSLAFGGAAVAAFNSPLPRRSIYAADADGSAP